MNEQLNHIFESAAFIIPELLLTLAIIATITLGVLVKQHTLLLKSVAFLTYSVIILFLLNEPSTGVTTIFGGMLRVDAFANYFKLLFLTGGLIGVWMHDGRNSFAISEYLVLLYGIVLGSCLMASTTNFITALLSLEIVSLSSYLLVGFGFDRKSSEGSLKYFLFGTVATACMIYGLSILYGLTGTLDFSSDQFVETLIENTSPLFLIAGLLALAGLLFKITAVPFHLWAPDVYESTPLPIVAFISVVPKLAGIALLARFTLAINLFGQSGYNWQIILSIVSLISILFGNLSALLQKNPKRMLAYSSVAQAGFLLIGLVSFSLEGIQFTLFYAAIFMIMNFLVFQTIGQFQSQFGNLEITSFSGLGRLLLFPALALLTGMVALTGLPPTAGFTAKFFIFGSLWASYQEVGEITLLILFITGLINTIIALFYYLKIPFYLFIKETPAITHPIKIEKSSNLLSAILVIILIYLFISPNGLMGWINKITFVL